MILQGFVTGGSPFKINTRCPKAPITCIVRGIVHSFGGRGEVEREKEFRRAGHKTELQKG